MRAQIRRLKKVGNSAAVVLPKAWSAQNGVKPGGKVRNEVSDRAITITPFPCPLRGGQNTRFSQQVRDFLRRNEELLRRLAK